VLLLGRDASDPLVLSVGGSTLHASHTTGAYLSETAWGLPYGTPGTWVQASGGGFSHLFTRPAYQDGVPAFVVLASRLVSSAMLPLAAGLAIDVHLVARVITGRPTLAATIGVVVFVLFVALWFAFPQWRAAQVRRQGRR